MLHPCQLPPPLQSGDLLRAVAPSGTLREVEKFKQGVEIWRSHGFRVEISPAYEARSGYLAGTDTERREQLRWAIADPACRGILCVRGGYGGARLLESWDWDMAEPKWLVGFSDITSLLWSLCREGVAGVHGPLLTTLATEPDWSVQRLMDLVTGKAIAPLQGKGWHSGQTRGILLPANLTVATHLLHTSAQPALEGVILAFEDVSEAPYRIDRMLTHWRMSGALAKVAGIALGRFSQCDPPAHAPSFSVTEVLRDRLLDLGIPVVAELPFGHDGDNAALPVGVMATLDGDRGILTIGEFKDEQEIH